jgi:hypothetical protein
MKLLKYGIYLVALTLLVSCATVKEEQGKYKVTEMGHFLWKAESQTAKVYLLGSIHLAKPDMYPLPDFVEKAFDESDALVVEINTENVNPMDMMAKAMYGDKRTLKNELSEETYNKLAKMFDENKIMPFVYNRMKPWFAVMMVLTMELAKAGYEKDLGIDKYFMDKAKDKKDILELESLDFQVNLFDNELEQFQEQFVKYSLMDQENMINEVDELVRLWKTNNVDEMERIVLQEVEQNEEFKPLMNKMYGERNNNMLKKIEGYLQTDKTYFVVVGSAHLVGEKGIVKMLKKIK